MSARLTSFVADLQQAKTPEALRAAVLGLRDRFQVEHLVYHSVKSTGRPYAVASYAPSWVARYADQNYVRIDPVVQGCIRRFHPVDWRHLDWSGRRVRNFLAEALAAGVGPQGISVPIRGPQGQFALFSVSDHARDPAWDKFTARHVGDLILVAHFIHQKALELERGSDVQGALGLSPREIDVLTLLARGQSRSQASDFLAISEHTLRAYLESARVKLGAANTTHAVACAVAAGQVLP